jgi:tRNA(fMet)-specific endonuclease VapC
LPGYLLDTNTISALMKGPQTGRLAQRVERAGERNVFTSVIVAAELRYGYLKNPSRRLQESLDIILGALEVKPLQANAIEPYARLRVALEQAGQVISGNDMLIAAHAMALDATLVTHNEREFVRVAGLQVENWLR